MSANHRPPAAETTVSAGTRVQVNPASGGGAGVVVEDFGPLPADGVAQLDRDTMIRPRRYAIALDDGTLIFLDAHEFTTP